jgi:hypothetical protein
VRIKNAYRATRGTGYARGHTVPDADMGRTTAAQANTYLVSNLEEGTVMKLCVSIAEPSWRRVVRKQLTIPKWEGVPAASSGVIS